MLSSSIISMVPAHCQAIILIIVIEGKGKGGEFELIYRDLTISLVFSNSPMNWTIREYSLSFPLFF